MPRLDELPDAVFVEDTALVLDEGAICKVLRRDVIERRCEDREDFGFVYGVAEVQLSGITIDVEADARSAISSRPQERSASKHCATRQRCARPRDCCVMR